LHLRISLNSKGKIESTIVSYIAQNYSEKCHKLSVRYDDQELTFCSTYSVTSHMRDWLSSHCKKRTYVWISLR